MSRLTLLNGHNNTINVNTGKIQCTSKLVCPDQSTIPLFAQRRSYSQQYSHTFNLGEDLAEGQYTQVIECGKNRMSFNKTFLFSNAKENRVQMSVCPIDYPPFET